MYLIINKWVITVKISNFSGQYLRNHWTLDIGVLGYIGIVWPKEHSPEVRSFPPGIPCIKCLKQKLTLWLTAIICWQKYCLSLYNCFWMSFLTSIRSCFENLPHCKWIWEALELVLTHFMWNGQISAMMWYIMFVLV